MLSPKEYISLEGACASIKANNPALMEQLSKQMLSILDPESQFNPVTVCALHNGQPCYDVPITYQDIGDYFLAASGKHVPVLLHTQSRTLESGRVFISRDWISRQLKALDESMRVSATIDQPAANQSAVMAQIANSPSSRPWVDQPAPMSADGYKNLHKWLSFQNDQRKANEAASKLTIELANMQVERDRYAAQAAVLSAENAHLASSSQLLTNENLSQTRTIQAQMIEITRKNEEIDRLQSKSTSPNATNVQVRNLAVRAAKKAAQALAGELWITEEFAGLRVGQMAIEVWALMHDSQHAQAMPEHADTVTNWLKEGEPPKGASRPGRPKKKK